ncbi:MAG: hypothetical protein II961_02135 [Candidatus Riflebacteria bacterium]|nr:hypothetical protein [Candidatus Riflebacteria bacterium]
MNNKKAVSMIEIMIGVMLLALILVPSLNVIIGQTQTVTATRDHAQAAFIAEKILETAKSYSFDMLDEERQKDDDAKKKNTYEYRLKNDEKYNTFVTNGITYVIDPEATSIDPIKIKNANDDTIPNVYAFKYSIKYTAKDGREHHLDISTILAQR